MQILFDEQGTYLTLGLQNYAYTGNRDLIAFKLSAMGLGLGPDWNRTGTGLERGDEELTYILPIRYVDRQVINEHTEYRIGWM